jgi:hypothetical protein
MNIVVRTNAPEAHKKIHKRIPRLGSGAAAAPVRAAPHFPSLLPSLSPLLCPPSISAPSLSILNSHAPCLPPLSPRPCGCHVRNTFSRGDARERFLPVQFESKAASGWHYHAILLQQIHSCVQYRQRQDELYLCGVQVIPATGAD